jgi:hypothetical protein
VRHATPGRLAAVALLALVLAACARHHEVQRLPAPGGGVDALLEAAELGTDLGYEIRIVPSGAPASTGALALRFAGVAHHGNAPGVKLQWLQPGLLLVRFEDSRSRELTPSLEVAGHVVRIELQQGALD